MSVFYERSFRVDSRDVDPFNQCRPSALLGYLQEAATEAACALHVSREEMIDKYHVFWMLARMWYRLDRPLFWDDTVTIRTWHRGDKGASMYRDFDLFRDGERVGEAVSVWVLADLDTHKLFRLSNVMEFRDTTGGELCKDKALGRLRVPVALHPAEERPMRYSDADINGHVNNVRYADFACDALDMQRLGAGRRVSSLQIGYLKECRPGEKLHLHTGFQDGTHYVRGQGIEGKARFESALLLSPLDKPGAGA